jgi:hypothetical protein
MLNVGNERDGRRASTREERVESATMRMRRRRRMRGKGRANRRRE